MQPACLRHFNDGHFARDSITRPDRPPKRVVNRSIFNMDTHRPGQYVKCTFTTIGQRQLNNLSPRPPFSDGFSNSLRHLRGR